MLDLLKKLIHRRDAEAAEKNKSIHRLTPINADSREFRRAVSRIYNPLENPRSSAFIRGCLHFLCSLCVSAVHLLSRAALPRLHAHRPV